MIKALIGVVGRFIGYLFLFWTVKNSGKTEQKLDQAEDALNDLKIVKNARDRMRAVDAADSRLREKYTRK